MPDDSLLRPADPAEVADALAYALRYDGNRRVFHADDFLARITAEHLVRHLAQAGFVLMRAEPTAAPTTSNKHAVLAMLAFDCPSRGIKHPDPPFFLPDIEPAARSLSPCRRNGLFIGVTISLDKVDDLVVIIEKVYPVVRHDRRPP
jgi:hypothetical protein